jgi:DNA (cytosine-5)-methyltransferase 1
MRRVVADVAPRYVFAENVQRRAINRAAEDLEAMGYDARCMSLSARDVGADHIRERYWVLAHADMHGELREPINAEARVRSRIRPRVWEAYPDEPRMAPGLAHRMERLRATGNGQSPAVAAIAFLYLAQQFN